MIWRRVQFDLVTCELQLQEFRDVTRRPKIRNLIRTAMAGEMVNQLRSMAQIINKLPPVDVSPDPFDNFLLSLAQTAQADVLVSGDKREILDVKSAWDLSDFDGAGVFGWVAEVKTAPAGAIL